MKRFIPVSIALMITFLLFWKFFLRGHVPIPVSFQMAWYDPWKTEYSVNGVPTLPHKAVGDDIFRQIYPMRELARDSMLAGEIPLWNPYNGAGQPLLATLHTGIANPFSVLPWSWFVIVQTPLLFLAMYWFLRTRKTSRFAATLGAVVLCVSGVAVARYPYGDYIYALIGLPVLLALVERGFYGCIPIIVGFVLVSVQPQISAYVLLAVAAYAWVRRKQERVRVILMMLLGVGLSAFQLLPTLELYQSANVTADSSSFIFEKFLMPASHLLSVSIPNYFGNQGTYNFWGKTDYVETVASVGMIPVLLAVLGAEKHRLWGLGILATFIVTLDWFASRFFYGIQIPVLSTSIPTRMYVLSTFGIAVLAGFGADAKLQKPKALGVLAIGMFALFLSRHFGCPSEVPQCFLVAFRNTVLELMVFAAGLGLLFFRKARYGVVLVLVVAGVYNAWKFLPFSPPEYVEAPHSVLTALSEIAPERIAGLGAASFATDFATQYRYFDTNYYDPLYIRRYGELVSYVNTGDREKGLTRSDVNVITDATVSAAIAARRERFWDVTGTTALVTKKLEVGPMCRPSHQALSRSCAVLWEDEHWRVENRETALPRAYLVTDVRVDPDPDHMLSVLFDQKTDVFKTAFVEQPIEGVNIGSPVDEVGITLFDYDLNSITIELEASASSLLVLSDTWYPGWKASVDDQEMPVIRINYAFRGVVVPDGEHTVRFWYAPESFRWGIIVSALSFSMILGAGVWRVWKRK